MTGWNAEAVSFSLIAAVTGVGLWRLLPWARTAIMVVSCFEICSGIEQIVEMHVTRSCSSVDLTSAFVGALVLLYFSRKKIKQISVLLWQMRRLRSEENFSRLWNNFNVVWRRFSCVRMPDSWWPRALWCFSGDLRRYFNVVQRRRFSTIWTADDLDYASRL